MERQIVCRMATEQSRQSSSKRPAEPDRDNPFRVLTDDEIFANREQKKREKEEERRATQLLPLWQRSTATTRCRSIRRLRDLEDNDIPNHEENQDVVGSAVLAADSPALQHETEKGSSTTRNPLVRQEAPPENSQISVTEGGSYLDDCDEGTNDEHGTQLGEVWADGCAGDFENDGEEDPESGVNCLQSEPKGCRSATTEGNPEELTAEENGVCRQVQAAPFPKATEQRASSTGRTAGKRVPSRGVKSRPRRPEVLRDKESAHACVEKKREIFLVQMAVETRKAEILKLHGKVARREEALRAADQQLTKEMQKFDEFLRATDQRAHMAMKEADEVGRIKMEKQQTIRELHERLSALNARISKYEEIVQEGKMYKSFLDKLSPPAWIEEQEKKKQERIAIKRKEWAEKQLKLQQERIQKEVKDIDSETFEKISELEEKKRKAGKSFDEARHELEERAEKKKKQLRRRMQTLADFENEYTDGEDDDGELPMYFTEPGQLLELFRQLEEQNLFLIQNAQENEAALEDVLGKFEETKQQMEKRTGAIDSLIRQLQDQVKTQQQICGNLQTTLQKKKSEREEKMIFQQLTNKIGEVHAICGYEGDDANDAIRKLEQIEAKMEEYLAILDRYEGFLEAVTRAHTAATRKADNV